MPALRVDGNDFLAVYAASQWAIDNNTAAITVKGDSLLIIEQMRGNYKSRTKGLRPMHMKARLLAMQIGNRQVRTRATRAEQRSGSPVERWHGRQHIAFSVTLRP